MDEMIFYEARQPVMLRNSHEIQHVVKTKSKRPNSKRNYVACGVAIVITIFLIGLGLGFWSYNLLKAVHTDSPEEHRNRLSAVSHEEITRQISKNKIEMHLRFAYFNVKCPVQHHFTSLENNASKSGSNILKFVQL